MRGSPTELGGWTPGRFWAMAAALCVAQAGLVLLFAWHGQTLAPLAPSSNFMHVIATPLSAGELTRTFFAMDPTVFPLPSRHGFSDEAWLRLPEQNFDVPPEMEAPACLALDSAPPGTGFQGAAQSKSFLALAQMNQGGSELEPWPILPAPEEPRTQSLLEIQGGLADRQLNAPNEFPAETNAQLLSNSVVQIAVDSAGQVVAAHLLDRSGSADVDGKALSRAWQLRFRPVPLQPPLWGKAVFEWQTAEPTNANPGATP